MKDFIYSRLADRFEKMIQAGLLKAGDRLPSVRYLSKQEGISLSTAFQTFIELESRGFVEARLKSGYYVSNMSRNNRQTPSVINPGKNKEIKNVDEIIERVYKDVGSKSVLPFSMNMPSTQFLPVAKLKTSALRVLREKQVESLEYSDIRGIPELRKEIARLCYRSGIETDSKDIIVTAGCIEAVNFAVKAVTKPGDYVAVDSPTYFGIFQAIEALGRKVLEIPADPETGVSLEHLEKQIKRKRLTACVFVTNFNNPLGAVIPDERKKALVKLLNKNNVVLIEDDIYGELYYSGARPRTCKSFDKKRNVILCSSFSKTIAPGYRIGWVHAGKHHDKIMKSKLVQSFCTPALTQEILTDFLKNGRYDLHMKNFRKRLHIESLSYLDAIHKYFPQDIKITQPRGGFFFWCEMDKHINSIDLFNQLMKENISIAPGQMFSRQSNFTNFFRISFGLPFSDEVEAVLKKIGEKIYELGRSKGKKH